MRIIAHRAPEAADHVVSVEVFASVVEVIDLLAERMADLAARVEASGKPAGGVSAPPLSADRQPRRGQRAARVA
jgi:hypothetical protein